MVQWNRQKTLTQKAVVVFEIKLRRAGASYFNNSIIMTVVLSLSCSEERFPTVKFI